MEIHHEQANPKNAVVSAVSPPFCRGPRLVSEPWEWSLTLEHLPASKDSEINGPIIYKIHFANVF